MSVGRQELLIQELEVELLALSEGERQLTNDYLTNGYKSEIARGSLLDQTVLNKEMLEKYMTTAVNANFEGANGRSVSGVEMLSYGNLLELR